VQSEKKVGQSQAGLEIMPAPPNGHKGLKFFFYAPYCSKRAGNSCRAAFFPPRPKICRPRPCFIDAFCWAPGGPPVVPLCRAGSRRPPPPPPPRAFSLFSVRNSHPLVPCPISPPEISGQTDWPRPNYAPRDRFTWNPPSVSQTRWLGRFHTSACPLGNSPQGGCFAVLNSFFFWSNVHSIVRSFLFSALCKNRSLPAWSVKNGKRLGLTGKSLPPLVCHTSRVFFGPSLFERGEDPPEARQCESAPPKVPAFFPNIAPFCTPARSLMFFPSSPAPELRFWSPSVGRPIPIE